MVAISCQLSFYLELDLTATCSHERRSLSLRPSQACLSVLLVSFRLITKGTSYHEDQVICGSRRGAGDPVVGCRMLLRTEGRKPADSHRNNPRGAMRDVYHLNSPELN